MFYRDSAGEVIGVLNDFDLSLMGDISSGRERIGTPLFMARSFLHYHAICDEGEQPVHEYWHDAESFIWVLLWVSRRYAHGSGHIMHYRWQSLLGTWFVDNATESFYSKDMFLSEVHSMGQDVIELSHKSAWKIALSCLRIVYETNELEKMDDRLVFQNWFYTQVPSQLQEEYPLVHC